MSIAIKNYILCVQNQRIHKGFLEFVSLVKECSPKDYSPTGEWRHVWTKETVAEWTKDMCQKNVVHSKYIGRLHGDNKGYLYPLDAMTGSGKSKAEEGNSGWGMVYMEKYPIMSRKQWGN